MKSIFLLCLFTLTIACNQPKQNPPDRNTEVFAYYLKTAFGDSIRNEKHIYIMIPAIGCKGCRTDALVVLHNEIIKSGEKNATYILSPSVNLADSLIRPCRFLIDSSGLIDRINLPISNIAILKTSNGKVISLVSIRSEITDSIPSLLRK
ncbi:MAG TPA: hypothetical protein VFJ43_14460 [Bacteroidia bacterium]|nr:hypothetical protein [Bacteroidia bacterium]